MFIRYALFVALATAMPIPDQHNKSHSQGDLIGSHSDHDNGLNGVSLGVDPVDSLPGRNVTLGAPLNNALILTSEDGILGGLLGGDGLLGGLLGQDGLLGGLLGDTGLLGGILGEDGVLENLSVGDGKRGSLGDNDPIDDITGALLSMPMDLIGSLTDGLPLDMVTDLVGGLINGVNARNEVKAA